MKTCKKVQLLIQYGIILLANLNSRIEIGVISQAERHSIDTELMHCVSSVFSLFIKNSPFLFMTIFLMKK